MPTRRSRAVTAAILSFFAVIWFGWAQAGPPDWMVVPLAVGSVLAVLVLIAGVVLTARTPGSLPAASDPQVRTTYQINVGIEFGAAGVGAAILGATGQQPWIGVWICAVVGVHFIPMAAVLADRSLVWLGGLLVLSAAAGAVTALSSDVEPVSVTGAVAGLCLLVFAAVNLLRVRA